MKWSIIIYVWLFFSCTQTDKSKNEAIILNDKAVSVMIEAEMSTEPQRDSLYKVSYIYLEKAFIKDSTNLIVAANKTKVEFLMGEYRKAISTLKVIENNRGKISSEQKFLLGLCYLRMDKKELAMDIFKQAANEFIIRGDTFNYYIVKCFTEGKSSVLLEIDTIQSLTMLKNIITSIDVNHIDSLFL